MNPSPPTDPQDAKPRDTAPPAPHDPARRGLRSARLRRGLAWALAFALTAGLIFGAWTVYADGRARSNAEALCAAINPGDPESGVMQRALDAGADANLTRWVQPMIGPRWLAAVFTGWRPGAHHLCVVTVADGKVREGRYERGN